MSAFSPDDLIRLRRRRQFLLAPTDTAPLPGWRTERVSGRHGDDLFLHTHPELGLAHARGPHVTAWLLGYAIDPDHPDHDDQAIADELVRGLADARSAPQATERLGGRFIVIVADERETLLFTDPCGLRQVFQTLPSAAATWCASEPGLIAKALGFDRDPVADAEFARSSAITAHPEYWWPGVASPFVEIEHLLPSHFLDLATRETERFWPWAPREPGPMLAAAEECADLLDRLLIAGRARFPLAVTMTAGFDTRTILAASVNVSDDAWYHTLTHAGLSRDDTDCRVPRELLGGLGVAHHELECPSLDLETASDEIREFAAIYRANVTDAHEAWIPLAYAMYRDFPPERVSVKGNCSETGRNAYYRFGGHPESITAADLARYTHMDGNAFAERHFGRWLEGARHTDTELGYNLLDVLFIEQRMGNWQAMAQLEWDLFQESYTPFNCRAVLDAMLRVAINERGPQADPLHTEICRILWPEVLSLPVNPTPLGETMVHLARRAKTAIGLLRPGVKRRLR